ncbi:RNA polymerase subunit sigma-70, partial [Candidatus Dojkabacteria bacterium]|nr:RNA polymerase subunit sigma-70 [Candidatus Dojkabacteria bacterium]
REKINELDEQTSEIILLKVWEEMTFLEISEIVDMKEDAVKKRYYRGINVLHTLLK